MLNFDKFGLFNEKYEILQIIDDIRLRICQKLILLVNFLYLFKKKASSFLQNLIFNLSNKKGL